MKIAGNHQQVVDQLVTCLNVASGYPELHEGDPENRSVETLRVSQAFEQLGITQLAGLIRAAVLEADRREPAGSTRLRETLRQRVFWPSDWIRKADSIAEACCRIPPAQVKCEVAITGVRVGFTSQWLSGTVLCLGSRTEVLRSMADMKGHCGGYETRDTVIADGDCVYVTPIVGLSPSTAALSTTMRNLVLRTTRIRWGHGADDYLVAIGSDNAISAFGHAAREGDVTVEEECEIPIATGLNLRLCFGPEAEGTVPAVMIPAVRLRKHSEQTKQGADLQEGGLEP